jgi:class 3 adenylate cyclase/tetratricopeptide (TPR) repeat protein
MQCRRCHTENRDGVRFCEECGASLAPSCASCGAALLPDKRFCGACGAPVASAAPERYASPQGYTPKHLADKILTSKSALEGERKQVTVLFADLKGSLELLGDRDPEEARALLDPVLERMMAAVHRYEGTVNQVMGDGIMALFGAPLAHEDHAVRACYAALRMQDTVRRYAEEVRRRHGIPLHIRVGLNSGEVVVRSIGSDLHMDYTAVGQTTHLAARMEQLAAPGSVLITADVLRLAEGYAEVKPLGPIPVKGLAEPVEVFEVTGAGAARTRFQATSARGLSRFVGRDAEMAQLRQTLEAAAGGRGRVVALVGEAGVGKSRLCWEFTHSHRARGWLVLESGSVSYGRATAYLPVIELLKAYFRIGDGEDERDIRERVTGKLLTLDRALEPTVPVFLSLLDVPVGDPGWQALDPQQRRERTLDAIRRLLLRESQVQPLLLVFEDLHWADSETQAVLDSLVGSLPAARILLLVNYRHEYQHGWGSRSYYAQIRLDPLPPGSAEELLQALLGGDPSLAPLKRLLIERTEGNPFFLEESVRTLVEDKVLAGERGAHRLARALPAAQVPDSVQAVLAARIDRLPPEDKRLLQSASVIGRVVPFALLAAIAGLPEDALRQSLARLHAAEFLYETTLFPDLEYAFKHALTHEVAYASLLQERRRDLHARIVGAMETLYADRRAEQVERLAHHALQGEVWDKALPYLREAGAKAFNRCANPEAAAYFEQALRVLPRLPADRAAVDQAISLRIALRHALLQLCEFGRVSELLREADALAESVGDQARRVRLACYMSNYFWLVGDHDAALEASRRAHAIAEPLGEVSLRVSANFYLAQALHSLGEFRRAIDFTRENAGLLTGDLRHQRFALAAFFVHSLSWQAWVLSEIGEFEEAEASSGDAIRVAQSLDRPELWVATSLGIGGFHVRRGDLKKATPMLEHGVEVCRRWDLPLWFAALAASLGYAYTLAGRLGEAIPLLEQAVAHGEAKGIMAYHSLWMAFLSEAYLDAGRADAAARVAERALDLARGHREAGHEVRALRLIGEVQARREPGRLEAARAAYAQALARAGELEMRPLVAQCRLGLAAIERRAGRADAAQAELDAAIAEFRAMGMTLWLTRAEDELARAASH